MRAKQRAQRRRKTPKAEKNGQLEKKGQTIFTRCFQKLQPIV